MSDATPTAPPHLAERILTAFLPSGVVGRSILGDAREEFADHVRRAGRARASAWYWGYALRLAAGYAWRRRRDETQVMGTAPRERARALLERIVTTVREGRELEMGTLWKDLRFGVRSVLRMPGSAAISVEIGRAHV